MTHETESFDPTRRMTVIHSMADIPTAFDTEAEEQTWWSTHELDEALWDSLPSISDTDLPPKRRQDATRSSIRKARSER